MPLLEFAKLTEIVTVTNGHQVDHMLEFVAKHLEHHAAKAGIKEIVADAEVANVILSHATDSSVDLMVMGGYSHPRLREFIFGGVTSEIIKAMTVPVLMSH